MPLNAQVAGMLLTGDGEWLVYLAESPSGARLCRLRAPTLTAGEPHSVPSNGTSILIDGGDGGATLVVMAAGLLLRVDLAAWTVEPFAVFSQGTVQTIAPLGGGLFLLAERRGTSFLLVADLRPGQLKVLSRFAAPFPGRLYLRTTPGGGRRFYVGTSAVFDGQIQAYDLAEGDPTRVTAAGSALRDGRRLLRGGLYLTPDGRHLLSGNGYAFAVPLPATR
jgi:hypothetical protein